MEKSWYDIEKLSEMRRNEALQRAEHYRRTHRRGQREELLLDRSVFLDWWVGRARRLRILRRRTSP